MNPLRKRGNRRARKRVQLFIDQSGICYYCLTPMRLPEGGHYKDFRPEKSPYELWATLDHYWPKSKNRGKVNQKVVLCCVACNEAKKHKDPEEFMNSLGIPVHAIIGPIGYY